MVTCQSLFVTLVERDGVRIQVDVKKKKKKDGASDTFDLVLLR